jgi:hypothetical protein
MWSGPVAATCSCVAPHRQELLLPQRRAPQLQWCPAAALQAERLHDGGHFHEVLRASLGIQATRLTFFEEGHHP